MSQRTKTYVAFDGDSDIMSYRTIQGWASDSACSFDLNDAHEVNIARDGSLPESIINQLRERLDWSKQLILIVGDKTKYNRKGILQYEMSYALRHKLPILLVFIGHSSEENNTNELWKNSLFPKLPSAIREADEKYCLICPFTRETVQNAMEQYSVNYLPQKGFVWHW